MRRKKNRAVKCHQRLKHVRVCFIRPDARLSRHERKYILRRLRRDRKIRFSRFLAFETALKIVGRKIEF